MDCLSNLSRVFWGLKESKKHLESTQWILSWLEINKGFHIFVKYIMCVAYVMYRTHDIKYNEMQYITL